jgi:hypothetical protein
MSTPPHKPGVRHSPIEALIPITTHPPSCPTHTLIKSLHHHAISAAMAHGQGGFVLICRYRADIADVGGCATRHWRHRHTS